MWNYCVQNFTLVFQIQWSKTVANWNRNSNCSCHKTFLVSCIVIVFAKWAEKYEQTSPCRRRKALKTSDGSKNCQVPEERMKEDKNAHLQSLADTWSERSTFYSWIDLEVSIQDSKWNDPSFSNIAIKSMNKDQEYDDAWNVSMTDVLFLPMLMRSWTWVMLAASTSSNNWPSQSDWPTHTVVGNALKQITFQPSIPQTDQHLKYIWWQNISTTILLPF